MFILSTYDQSMIHREFQLPLSYNCHFSRLLVLHVRSFIGISKRSPNFPPNGNKLCLSNKIICVSTYVRTIIDENLEILSHVWEGRYKNSDASIIHDDGGVIMAR